MAEELITANGRKYRQRPDGLLKEVSDPQGHAKRQLAALTSKHTITGLRIVDTDAPDDPAVLVTLDPSEAKVVLAAVKDVLKKRAG